MPRRTPEELIAHREEQNRKARLRLARAKDPRIELLEDTARLIEQCREHVEWDNVMPGLAVDKILAARDRLVDEAVKP